MSRQVYPGYLNRLATVGHQVGTVVGAVGVTSSYVYSSAHDNLDDVTSRVTGATWNLGASTIVASTVADIRNSDGTALSVPSGQTIAAIVLYVATGVEATSLLIAYIDDVADLPKNTNGNDIDLVLDPTALIRIQQA